MNLRHPFSVLLAVLSCAAALLVAAPASAQTVAQATIVSDDPASFTPNVLDGRVNAFAQIGSTIIAGGSFTQVQASGGGATLTRSNLIAFNATTGAISTTFVPNVAGEVYDVESAGDGTSVYVVGQFTQVNGTATSKVTRLNITSGAKVAGFTAPTISQVVKNVDLVNGRLLIGGSFTTVGGQGRGGLASLDPATGALTTFLNLPLSAPINGGDAQVLKMAVAPDGSRLVAIGNFTQIGTQPRSLIAMISLTGATASLANWSTDLYQDVCADAFDTYMRDLDFAPDSSYFVVSTTGAYGGPDSPCDVITRWESSATGSDLLPTWRDYTGGDTTYAVAVTGAAVYVGGHMRWLNNPEAGDAPGPGAVPREGIAALDPVSGLPLTWNPGRARGVGVFDLMATSTGLWVGSDTDRIGGETHRKIAFFPLAGGTTPPAQVLGSVPNDVYLLGQPSTTSDPGVLYRVNAGGGEIQSADDGPDWISDAEAAPYKGGVSNASGYGAVASVTSAVPAAPNDRAPAALFSSESWGPSTGSAEMRWAFPVAATRHVTVRLYFANRYSGTSQPGQRVYDVTLDGATVLPNFDPAARYGDQVGGMQSFDIISDGTVDIGFVHRVENPLINGIEIIDTGSQGGGGGGFTAADSVQRRNFTGTSAGPTSSMTPTVGWGLSRGAFMVDNTLYAVFADGTLTRRTFNGTTFGAATQLSLYGGSFGADIPNLTGLTYANGRIYYTLFGDDSLHWRWFSPQSGVVGETAFTADGAVGALDPARVRGMFLAGTTLYVADRASGDLVRIGLSGTTVTGPATTVDTANDWTGRSLVLWNGGAVPPPNVNPTASASATCPAEGLTCTFSSVGSFDSDGSITGYSWSFSDGGTSTAANPSHDFAAGGDYSATLTVTDNRGGTGSASTGTFHVTAPPPTAPVAAFTSSCSGLTCTFTNTSTGATGSSWVFGDGGTSTQTSPSHTYATPGGTFSVTLTVNGPGGTDDVSHVVTVSPVTSTISFRGAGTANGNTKTFAVPTPTGTQSGDVLLLFVSSALGSTPATPPAGWTLVGDQADGTDTRTTLYRRVAPATGSLGTVTWTVNTKTNLTVLAYAGAAAVPTLSQSAAKTTAASTSFTAPAVTVPDSGSVVVSFWAIRASAATTWTVPAGTAERADSTGSGSGQMGAAAADQLGVAAGPVAARTAVATLSSAKGIGWTVVLAAG